MFNRIMMLISFACLAITLKLFSAWSPVDIMILFCFWMGLQIKDAKFNFEKVSLLFFLMGTLIFSDYMFAVTHNRTFIYPGFWANHIAFILAAVVTVGLPKKLTTRAFGMFGISTAVILFFFVSNAGVFFLTPLYPKTGLGLQACYLAALPFLKVQWLSNIVGSSFFFAAKSLFVPKSILKENV
jgi:hypothetical protein